MPLRNQRFKSSAAHGAMMVKSSSVSYLCKPWGKGNSKWLSAQVTRARNGLGRSLCSWISRTMLPQETIIVYHLSPAPKIIKIASANLLLSLCVLQHPCPLFSSPQFSIQRNFRSWETSIMVINRFTQMVALSAQDTTTMSMRRWQLHLTCPMWTLSPTAPSANTTSKQAAYGEDPLPKAERCRMQSNSKSACNGILKKWRTECTFPWENRKMKSMQSGRLSYSKRWIVQASWLGEARSYLARAWSCKEIPYPGNSCVRAKIGAPRT